MRKISNKLYLTAATLVLAASLTNGALAYTTGTHPAGKIEPNIEGTQPYQEHEGNPVILSANGQHSNVKGLLDAHGIDPKSGLGRHVLSTYDDAVAGKARVVFIERPSKDSYRIAYDNADAAHFNEFGIGSDGEVIDPAQHKEPRPTLYRSIPMQKTLLNLKSSKLPVITVQCESLLHVQDKFYREKLAPRILKNLENMERFHKDDQFYTKDEIKFVRWYLKELNNKHTPLEAQANNDREMRKVLDTWHERCTDKVKPYKVPEAPASTPALAPLPAPAPVAAGMEHAV